MTYNNKENEFIDWICGVPGARFPYFRKEDMPEIPMPIIYGEIPEKKEKAEQKEEEILPKEETLIETDLSRKEIR